MLFIIYLLWIAQSTTAWTLIKSYNVSNIFEEFIFETAADPTHGDVQYVSQDIASAAGLIGTRNGASYMGVDYKTVNPPNGRESVRLSSKTTWFRGLFIADIAHMPGSICGVWPAFWLVGASWPAGGEIDIIEGVNLQATNDVTLHTAPGCTVSNEAYTLTDTNCNSNNGYNGCGIASNDTTSYGTSFNTIGGGVYAMQWTSTGIAVWFFPRSQIPADISNGHPNPNGWKTPMAYFSGSSCDFANRFGPQQIVFDTTFCGDWAGESNTWASSGCAAKASTCNAYVNANPSAFQEAYWLVNHVRVYQ